MNKQIMIKHYEATSKETLIDTLVASREEVEKLQNKNKECKQEIERLSDIIYGIRDRLKQITESYSPNSSGLYFTVKKFAYDDLDKILNELNIENKSVFDYAYKLEVENKRLNNIINELEKWLIDRKYKEGTYCIDCNQVLNKLQKLKGEDKE